MITLTGLLAAIGTVALIGFIGAAIDMWTWMRDRRREAERADQDDRNRWFMRDQADRTRRWTR